MSVQCLVSGIEGERRARNEPKEKEKKRCSSPVESFWLVLARFPPKKKRRAEAKPLSPALCMTACCCATGPHTLFTRVSSASSLFYTFDILRAGGGGDGGCHESLTPPFDCCSPYSVGSAAYEERGEVKQALKSVSIRGNMLCFSAAVQLLRLGWQFDDYVRNHTHTRTHGDNRELTGGRGSRGRSESSVNKWLFDHKQIIVPRRRRAEGCYLR